MSFFDHTDLETYLNIDIVPGYEAWADDLCAATQAWAEARCGYPFAASEQTEYFDRTEVPFRLGTRAPIDATTIAIALFDPSASDYTAYTGTSRLLRDNTLILTTPQALPTIYPLAGDALSFYEDGLYNYTGWYGHRILPDAIRVTYTAGWDSGSFPADLKDALVVLTCQKFFAANDMEQGQVFEVKAGEYSERYSPSLTGKGTAGMEVPDTVLEVVDRYRRLPRV